MQKRPIFSLFAIFFGALVLCGIWMYENRSNIAVLNPAGPVALDERAVILFVLLLSLVVVIPVFALLFIFAWRYRADGTKTAKRYAPEAGGGHIVEILSWGVPTIIIIIASAVAWQSSHVLDPFRPLAASMPPMTVEVVALDWKWLFIYPAENIATVNMLEIPENTPVHFEITADAPMNSFWIPQLGGQIMAMPGMSTQLNLLASRTGDFNGLSGNISGEGFSGMTFDVKSVTPDDFNTWVESVKQSGNALTSSAYTSLAQPSAYNPTAYYSSVAENLYTATIMRYMTPGMENDSPQTAPTTANAMPGMSMGTGAN